MAMAKEIRSRALEGELPSKMVDDYNINITSIWKILQYKTYANGEMPTKIKPIQIRMNKRASKVHLMRLLGLSYRTIAKVMGVSSTQIVRYDKIDSERQTEITINIPETIIIDGQPLKGEYQATQTTNEQVILMSRKNYTSITVSPHLLYNKIEVISG